MGLPRLPNQPDDNYFAYADGTHNGPPIVEPTQRFEITLSFANDDPRIIIKAHNEQDAMRRIYSWLMDDPDDIVKMIARRIE